jgi:hypothetical protein
MKQNKNIILYFIIYILLLIMVIKYLNIFIIIANHLQFRIP